MIVELSGYSVIIDDEDYHYIKDYKYTVNESILKLRGLYYFSRSLYCSGKRVTTSLHRDIMGCVNGDTIIVDHINGNTLDCRKQNLRLCNRTENNRNAKIRKDNTSGYKGVCFDKRTSSWRVRISVDRKYIHIGRYKNIEDAYIAYCEASNKYHKEFGRIS